jgi:hypothetical protein
VLPELSVALREIEYSTLAREQRMHWKVYDQFAAFLYTIITTLHLWPGRCSAIIVFYICMHITAFVLCL